MGDPPALGWYQLFRKYEYLLIYEYFDANCWEFNEYLMIYEYLLIYEYFEGI